MAEYNENKKIFKTIGLTKIVTSENYLIEGENIVLNKQINSILSDRNTIVKDEEGNSIYLNSFEYKKNDKIFKSIGLIKIEDKLNNSYEFSQIYIDTEKKEILGSDVSSYLNNEQFKVNEKNNPRIMANTFIGKKDKRTFKKVYSHYVNIEKMTKEKNVLPGLYKPAKCYMIIKRKLSIMITR